MSSITLVKQHPIEIPEADKDAARRVMFGLVDGLGLTRCKKVLHNCAVSKEIEFRSSESRRNESRATQRVSGFFIAQHGSSFGGPCGTLARGCRPLVRSSNPYGLPPSFRSVGGRFTTYQEPIMAKSLGALVAHPSESTSVNQVEYLLMQISEMALSIDRLAINISPEGEDDSAATTAISAMASQIRWLVELSEEKLGSKHKAEAIDYLTSPAYLELERGVMQ